MSEYSKLEKLIGYKFKDKTLLRNVFVHRSYLNENAGAESDSNERLEFLGDAVLELAVTDFLYRNYPNPEGDLTNWRAALVKGTSLAEIAKGINLGEYLLLSKGEEKAGGKSRELILANAFEALLGAIYLEVGCKKAKELIDNLVSVNLKEILEKKLYIDSKSQLQELAQGKMGFTPRYEVLNEYGPDHAKSFTIGVYIGDKLTGEGSGSSKQLAQQAAASDALENWSEFSI